jgi:hypothetical protein
VSREIAAFFELDWKMIELLFLQEAVTAVEIVDVTCSNVSREVRSYFDPTGGFHPYQGVVPNEHAGCDWSADVVDRIRNQYTPNESTYSMYAASAYPSFAFPESHFYIRNNMSNEAQFVSVFLEVSETVVSSVRVLEPPRYLIFNRPASYSEQSHIEFLIQGMSICNSSESTEPGLDGTNWVFEEWALNGHCTHSMWSPRFGELARFGNYVSSLGQRMLSDHIGLESEEE